MRARWTLLMTSTSSTPDLRPALIVNGKPAEL
jgi:hypothetical protein